MNFENLADPLMREFKESHSSGSYLCSYQGCPRASQGFSSLELRQQHEESHAPRFQCSNPACGFWKCSSEAALRKHTTKYHDGQDVSGVPNSFDSSLKGAPQERSLFRLATPRIKSPMQEYPIDESLTDTGFSKANTSKEVARDYIFQLLLLNEQQHGVPTGWQAKVNRQERLENVQQMYVT